MGGMLVPVGISIAFGHIRRQTIYMIPRPVWAGRIAAAWRRRPVVWLAGVRRVGKTTLCRSLADTAYFDCELPSVRRQLSDPESFLRELDGKHIVLDEVHRLDDPAELLKIAADHFPRIRVLATGSSTLGASARFRDTLAGRKAEVWLAPMVHDDLPAFGKKEIPRFARDDNAPTSLSHRLHQGGLPPFFLAPEPPERNFQEWLDAYWAKDILELFRLERRQAFQRLFELMLASSGGLFEATRFARAREVSRQTIQNYLAVLEATFVAHVVRPWTTHKPTELVSAPKVYGFDTGFVAYYRGWQTLRADDLGLLWEHYVLNELHASRQARDVRYWRDKQGHEIDFVLASKRGSPMTIECKWKAATYEPDNLRIFRRHYPRGSNLVVTSDTTAPYDRTFGDLTVRFVGIAEGPLLDHA
jgi:predicted AAA+ superfamily ATPase